MVTKFRNELKEGKAHMQEKTAHSKDIKKAHHKIDFLFFCPNIFPTEFPFQYFIEHLFGNENNYVDGDHSFINAKPT